MLGVDRDSSQLQDLFDERDPAVKRAVSMVVEAAQRTGTTIGICGQGPSDHPDVAEFLVGLGIDSMSLDPDAVIPTRRRVAELEAARGAG